jgi:hypothetical protein
MMKVNSVKQRFTCIQLNLKYIGDQSYASLNSTITTESCTLKVGLRVNLTAQLPSFGASKI